MDDLEVGTKKGRNRSVEYAKPRHEGQQRLGRMNNLLWLHDLGGRDGGENDAAAYVDVFREQVANIVGVADNVGR